MSSSPASPSPGGCAAGLLMTLDGLAFVLGRTALQVPGPPGGGMVGPSPGSSSAQREGLALKQMGGYDHQTVAGVISTSMSGGFARRSTWVTATTSSGPCARLATRSTPSTESPGSNVTELKQNRQTTVATQA